MPSTRLPLRSEVKPEHTWDLASIFPSTEAWEAEFQRISSQLPELASFQGRLAEGPQLLADWLETSERLQQATYRVYVYASMGHDVDTADPDWTARDDRAGGLLARVSAAGAFEQPELLAIGFETLRKWIASEPRLSHYAHYIDSLERLQAHVRSAEVEELLSHVQDPFRTAGATHGILADADLVFEPAQTADQAESLEVAQGTISTLLSHADREVRRTAWEHYADAHLAMKNTMANCLAAGVKQNVFLARARKYGSALEAALHANHLPVEVFHQLIAAFKKNLPTWHRYWRIRRKALGYEQLHAYDVRAPLTGRMPSIQFDQAVEWISAGMRPLGDEYVSAMRRGLTEQRWVDIYPNKGKRAGAYSTGVPGTRPFILMSYADNVFSLSTLAHELGHSMHSYFTWQAQPFVYTNYSLFVAEVASNFNQALVRAYLLDNQADPDFQIAVIEEAMANFHRYFFIMPTLARFELEIHERVQRGEALPAQALNTLMADLFREGYGGEVEIDADRIGITWGQFSTHLYANFYVFQYATGISGANALAQGVLAGRPGAAESYLNFLRAGGSLYPLDALRLAGVDLATSEPVEKTFGVLAGLVDRLEKLLG